MALLPRMVTTDDNKDRLTNGHTHLFSITDDLYKKWGNESKFKLKIANHISKGNEEKRELNYQECKKVIIVFGEDQSCMEDIKNGVNMNIPIIIIPGTTISDKIIRYKKGTEKFHNDTIEAMLDAGNIYCVDEDKLDDLLGYLRFL